MYLDKLSIKAYQRILGKIFNSDFVDITNMETIIANKDIAGDVIALNVDFEVSNTIFKNDGLKKGNLRMDEYFIIINNFDGKSSKKLDIDLIEKYQRAVLEELRQVDAALAEDYDQESNYFNIELEARQRKYQKQDNKTL